MGYVEQFKQVQTQNGKAKFRCNSSREFAFVCFALVDADGIEFSVRALLNALQLGLQRDIRAQASENNVELFQERNNATQAHKERTIRYHNLHDSKELVTTLVSAHVELLFERVLGLFTRFEPATNTSSRSVDPNAPELTVSPQALRCCA